MTQVHCELLMLCCNPLWYPNNVENDQRHRQQELSIVFI